MSDQVLPPCFFPGFGKKINLATATPAELEEFTVYATRSQAYVFLFSELVCRMEEEFLPDIKIRMLDGLDAFSSAQSIDEKQRVEHDMNHMYSLYVTQALQMWCDLCAAKDMDVLDSSEIVDYAMSQLFLYHGVPITVC